MPANLSASPDWVPIHKHGKPQILQHSTQAERSLFAFAVHKEPLFFPKRRTYAERVRADIVLRTVWCSLSLSKMGQAREKQCGWFHTTRSVDALVKWTGSKGFKACECLDHLKHPNRWPGCPQFHEPPPPMRRIATSRSRVPTTTCSCWVSVIQGNPTGYFGHWPAPPPEHQHLSGEGSLWPAVNAVIAIFAAFALQAHDLLRADKNRDFRCGGPTCRKPEKKYANTMDFIVWQPQTPHSHPY